MKAFALATLLAAFCVTQCLTAGDLPSCPPPGEGDIQIFQKPDNCSQYYECDNGQLKIMDCPPGLEFNAANRTCDFPWSAKCKEESRTLVLVEVQPIDLPVCPPPGEGDIQLFPKPDNCSQYYECDNGKLLIMDCPPGLNFNPDNNTCDYIWSAHCKESRVMLLLEELSEDLPDCPPPGEGDVQLFPKADNCSQYYECDNGQLVVMDCPPGLEFNADNVTCDYPWSAHCQVSRAVLVIKQEREDLPVCSSPGEGDIQLFPKPDNCSQYYECDNGKLLIMDCPPGLEFNADNVTCDYPWSAHCKVSRKVLILEEEEEEEEDDDLPVCAAPGEGDIQLFPKPDNCSQYYECDNGHLVVMDCPPGLEFNADNVTCDFPWSAHCQTSRVALVVRQVREDLPVCSSPGEGDIQLFPKPDNCSQYYECDNGKLLIMDCPPGLEFNAANRTCDFSWSAHCKESRLTYFLHQDIEVHRRPPAVFLFDEIAEKEELVEPHHK